MEDVAFTFDWYRSFLERLVSGGYRFRSYDDQVLSGDALVRHDVDLSPERALDVARFENELGVSSTFFFLLGSPLYNPFQAPVRHAIDEITSLGHDIGLHFSTHQHWPATRAPDDRELTRAVVREREVLGTIVPNVVSTVSFHLPPPWVLERTFTDFPSTYEPRFFDEIAYRADSGQRWREEGIALPADEQPIQVLTHPGLWGADDGTFVERIREAVVEADRRVGEYVQSRHLQPERIRAPQPDPPEA